MVPTFFRPQKAQVVNGRLEYYRKKTGTFYSVKIEPEAQAIIDKYAGENYLLDVCDTWSNPTDYLRRMDKGLKKIGPMERKGQGGKKSYKGIFRICHRIGPGIHMPASVQRWLFQSI